MQIFKIFFPAHFTNRNKVVLLVSLLLSIASLIALFKLQIKDDDQSRKMLATLVDQKKFVSRKFDNSLSFIEINKGEKLFNGDQVFTGDDSTAKVVFQKSGNVINIPPKGLVKIVEGANGETVDIQKGLAEFIIQKGQIMNITQGNESFTLKNDDNEEGSGRIFFKDNKLVLEVDAGRINLIDSSGAVQEFKKSESAPVEDEVVEKISGVGLIHPVSEQEIDIWQSLDLEWSNKAGIDAVLYRDSEYKEVVSSTTAETSPYNWSLPLEEGRYYLMVKVAGTEDKEATSIALNMISKNKITSFTPANNASVNIKRSDSLKLSWNEVPASAYRVTIKNQDNEKISFMTDKPEYEVQGIKGSSLDWSVAPQLASGVFLSDSETNHVSLIFESENTIISPKENQQFLLGKDKIIMSWTVIKNERSNVKITNISTNKVILEKDLIDGKMIFKPESPGAYSFAISSKNYPSATPNEVKFSVVSKIADWELNDPVEISSVDSEEKKIELKFIPLNKNLAEYELNVYNDSVLQDKILTSKVTSSKIIYTIKDFGTFCFILRPLSKVSAWLPSSNQCIIYSQKAPFDIIAATKNIVLKYTKVNGIGSYLITLPVVDRANFYEIQVFNNSKKVIFSDRSKSNVIVWPSNKAGAFYYKYRVIDSKKRVSDYSGVSKLIFPISPLTDWNE